ncbi:MAG: cation diffusion facilitator family transporter [Candidatus Korobacteraceae bacterium]
MHAHDHGPPAGTARVLRVSMLVTILYIALLVVAGLRAHSLALLSEAAHNVSDFFALMLSSVAVYWHQRPPSATKTYGYHRAGVLAAFVNSLTLVGISVYICYEAIHRLYAPPQVDADIMIWVAAAGVVINGGISIMLYSGRRDLNVRSAFLHEIGDTLTTLAVIFGGWAIAWTGKVWIDPALSFLIAGLIVWSSVGIIRESLNILLEGTPKGIRLEAIAREITAIAGVNEVHDLHVWSLGSDTHALSCHIGIADIPPSESEAILREVRQRLLDKFHIHHTTIQFEHVVCDVAHGCVVPVGQVKQAGQEHRH